MRPSYLVLLLFVTTGACAQARATQAASAGDIARWEREAQNVTIYRDNWGIAHVYGDRKSVV